MTQGESFSNSLYTDLLHLAERELSAFIAAVRVSYGPEEAELSAEDWIEESELMDSSPRSEVRKLARGHDRSVGTTGKSAERCTASSEAARHSDNWYRGIANSR